MRGPGVVSASPPGVAFGITEAEIACAIGSFLQWADDGASGGNGAFVNGIDIFDNYIDAAGFNVAQIFGRFEAALVLVIFFRAEHNHSAVEGEFGMHNGAVVGFMDGFALETKDGAEPLNGGFGVAVTMSRDDGGVRFWQGEASEIT